MVLGILIVFVAAELIVRQVADDLPYQLRMHTASAEVKYDQMQEIHEAGESRDVVFGGSSIADNAFNSNQFTEITGESSFNAAVEGAGIRVNGPWMVDQVVPFLHPKVLVIGVNTLDFNAGISYNFVVRRYNDSWITKKGVLSDVERDAGERSQLVWERPLLRNIFRYGEIWDSLFSDQLHVDEVELQSRSYGPNGDKRLAFDSGGLPPDEIEKRYFSEFDFDTTMFQVWEPLIDTAHDQDIEVVIVNMPVQDEFKDLHPGGKATYDKDVELMRKGFVDRGADWIDASEWISEPQLFTDLHHLNSKGAEIITAKLAETLESQGVVS
jgi:hypothetical protein